MLRSRVWLLLAVAALYLLGCGPGLPPGARPTKPVKVTVAYKGSPVEGATITFINQEGAAAPAYGRTDQQGVAKMKTYVEGDGAVLGQHKVLIEKAESVGGSNIPQDSPEYNPNAPPQTVRYLLPQKYSNPASGLTAEVKESGPNDFTFDLKD